MPDTLHKKTQPSPALVLLCVCGYLAFSLQQVVIGHGLGVNLSLGSMLLRGFVLITTVWMFWHHGIPRPLRWPAAAIGLCLAAVTASALASQHREIALPYGSRYALELLLLWSVLNLSIAYPVFVKAAARATLILLWIAVLLSICLKLEVAGTRSLSLLFFSQETFDKYLPRSSGLYQHPALFAANAVIALALTMQLRSQGLYGRCSVVLAIMGCLLALLLSGARNPILGLLVLAAAGLWQLRGNPHARHWSALAGLLLAGLFAYAIYSRHAQLTSAANEGAFVAFSLGRPYIWAAAWKAWHSAPLFGLGPSVFQFFIPDYADGRFLRGELHAHNLLLGLLSELGLAGTLSFIVLGIALWLPWLDNKAPKRGWALLALLTLLSFGLFDYYQPFYGFAMHGVVLVGLLYTNLKPPAQTNLTAQADSQAPRC